MISEPGCLSSLGSLFPVSPISPAVSLLPVSPISPAVSLLPMSPIFPAVSLLPVSPSVMPVSLSVPAPLSAGCSDTFLSSAAEALSSPSSVRVSTPSEAVMDAASVSTPALCQSIAKTSIQARILLPTLLFFIGTSFFFVHSVKIYSYVNYITFSGKYFLKIFHIFIYCCTHSQKHPEKWGCTDTGSPAESCNQVTAHCQEDCPSTTFFKGQCFSSI